MNVCVCEYTHNCQQRPATVSITHVRAHIHKYVCLYTNMYLYMYTCEHVYMYVNTYVYTYMM